MQRDVEFEQIIQRARRPRVTGDVYRDRHAYHAHMKQRNEDDVEQHVQQVHNQRQGQRGPGLADPPQGAADGLNHRDARIRNTAADQINPGVAEDLRRGRPEQHIQHRGVKAHDQQADR
ncbi:hypothetical protein D1872_291020 [compost metagenome]